MILGGGIFKENNAPSKPGNMTTTYSSSQFKRPRVQF